MSTLHDRSQIHNNLEKAFPDSSFLVFWSEINSGDYQGQILFRLKDKDGDIMEAFKLSKSTSGKSVTNDELKQQCFCWVYDSKSMTDKTARCDFLKKKIGAMFPDNNVSIFVLNVGRWMYSTHNVKADCEYKREYGDSDVLIVLN